MRFEPLHKNHLARVLEIEADSNPAPWSEASFQNEIEHPEGEFLVGVEKGEIVGFGGFWAVIDEAHITNLAVSPAFRRRGFGRQLMDELLSRARDRGLTCSTLEVRAGNEAAIHLYESLGYQAVARRRRYYPDNNEDAVVMWLYDLGTESRT